MNKFIQKILKESSFEEIIDLIPDLGKKLGTGVNGVAYDYFGKVLKITMNLEDASLAFLLKERKPLHFTIIFSVEEIYENNKATGVYLIKREKLKYLNQDEHKILSDFNYLIEYHGDWNDKEFLELSNQYNPTLVKKLHKEYKQLFLELNKFKLYDLGPHNLGRKKDGTLAAFDAETNISFPDTYKKFTPFYIDSLDNENELTESLLKEFDDEFPNTRQDGQPLEFTEYMTEADTESLTMETGAIPNLLDEIVEAVNKLEKLTNKKVILR